MICLLIPAIEDVRSRSVHVVWPPLVLLISVLLSCHMNGSFLVPLWNVLVNSVLIGVLLLGSAVYIFLNKLRFSGFIDIYLGLGDILIIFSISALFQPDYFILFLTTAFVITLLAHRLLLFFVKSANNLIPLVTYINTCLIAVLFIDLLFLNHSLLLYYR